jgi:CheY-like chemotaxis protein
MESWQSNQVRQAKDLQASGSSLRVLVLDDEPSVRGLVRESLRRFGAEVTCTSEAEEALAMLEYRCFDVLVCDLKLGSPFRIEGLELVTEARYRVPQLGIVVHTGTPDEAVHRSCLSNGADEIVLKSEPLASLRAAVARAACRQEESHVAS